MVGGVLRVLACVALAVLLVGGVLYAREIAARSRRLGRHLHLVREPPQTPPGPPLEQIARNLRRLRPEARSHRPGTPLARYLSVVAAYDDLLVDACHAVGVATSLTSLPDGLEREAERLRVEVELERAGISLRAA